MSEAHFVTRGASVFLISTEGKGNVFWPSDHVAPDAPALFRRSIPEIRARAATSRYWAQRLRWLRKRGRA